MLPLVRQMCIAEKRICQLGKGSRLGKGGSYWPCMGQCWHNDWLPLTLNFHYLVMWITNIEFICIASCQCIVIVLANFLSCYCKNDSNGSLQVANFTYVIIVFTILLVSHYFFRQAWNPLHALFQVSSSQRHCYVKGAGAEKLSLCLRNSWSHKTSHLFDMLSTKFSKPNTFLWKPLTAWKMFTVFMIPQIQVA